MGKVIGAFSMSLAAAAGMGSADVVGERRLLVTWHTAWVT